MCFDSHFLYNSYSTLIFTRFYCSCLWQIRFISRWQISQGIINFQKENSVPPQLPEEVFNPHGLIGGLGCHYNKQRDLAFCCQQAVEENKLQWASNSDDAFIQRGFSNWKAAVDKFSQHEKSKCHKESILKIITAPSTMEDVAESLSKQVELDKRENRHCFLKNPFQYEILGSSRYWD